MLRALGAQVWSGKLMWVSGAVSKFDKEGNLTDDGVSKQLAKFMGGFVDFVGLRPTKSTKPILSLSSNYKIIFPGVLRLFSAGIKP